jgi:ribonuclease HII
MKNGNATPSLARFDAAVRKRVGIELLGGVDEAGRGALAGPVVAACVVLGPGTSLPEVNDSKVLTPEKREALAPLILERAAAWGVGWASAAEVDQINILQATLLAARRAMETLTAQPEYLLTDFLKMKDLPCPVEPLVDGDARSLAIAAASVLAKVARDRIMAALHREYPVYQFAAHKGYGTAAHWAALEAHGPSTLHRLTFRGVCFFNAEPSVRAASRAQMDERPRPEFPACPDWRAILTTPAAELDPLAFLPECEWE